MRPSFPLFASHRWYEWFPLATPVAQHPTMWRFLAYGQFRGSANLGIPSSSTFSTGYGVFDWDYGTGRYELTWFDPTPDYWNWAVRFSSSFSWVSDTEVRIVGGTNDFSADTVRHAAKFSVAANGRFTWIEPLSTRCGNDLVSDAVFYPGWAIGYNGGIIYPYANGVSSPPPSSNCYIGKITSTNSATNLGPLRSGLTQGAQHAPLCPLGASAAGNGYAVGVQSCYQDSQSSTMYVGLYNVANVTPSLVTTRTYTGRPNTHAPLHLGAGRVLVPDYHDSNYNGKVSLLYTNSDTSPSLLTVGATAFAPAIPFRAGDLNYALPTAGGFCCQNFWVGEGKGAGIVVYMLNKNLEPGETYRQYLLPCVYNSSGPTNLTITLLTHDADGNVLPTDQWWSSDLRYTDNYAIQLVGAPGNKAAMFWRIGNTPSATNQTVVQL